MTLLEKLLLGVPFLGILWLSVILIALETYEKLLMLMMVGAL